MKCFRCAVDHKYKELHAIDAQSGGPAGDEGKMRVIVMCQKCWDDLEPDMWTCEEHWMAMKPAVPFDKLPVASKDDYKTDHWKAQKYESFAPP